MTAATISSWSQTIPQVKKTDVDVLGWRGYTWSAVVRPVGRTHKLTLVAYGRERWLMVEKLTLNYLATALSGNSSCNQACQMHAP